MLPVSGTPALFSCYYDVLSLARMAVLVCQAQAATICPKRSKALHSCHANKNLVVVHRNPMCHQLPPAQH